MPSLNTVNTTRIAHTSPIEMSVEVSQMLWPAANAPNRPKVVILVPEGEDYFPYAFMATGLVHDPIMGVLLFSAPDQLSNIARDEIVRLAPSGTQELPPVIMVGPFDRQVARAIERLDYQSLQISGKTVFATAANVARLRKEVVPISPDGPVSLFVIGIDNPFDGLPATYYAAHAGVPILFTERRRLPQATARVLREMADMTVYVVGGKNSVSEAVLREIADITDDGVHRIAGPTPFATSVLLATYYDADTHLGWNRVKKGCGDAFTFANLEYWDLAVAACGLAHQSKHTPLLLLEPDRAPAVVLDYVTSLKPEPHGSYPKPPYMHGFILGTDQVISYDTQAIIEQALNADVPPPLREDVALDETNTDSDDADISNK